MLKDKVALVLGAASAGNMGQAIAARFHAEGAHVMIAGRDQAELSRFAETIGAASRHCDITKLAELQTLVATTIAKFGRLDIAVNATGLNLVQPFLEVDEAQLQRVTQVQFIGTFLFMQAVLEQIADRGAIIQISSVSASALLPNHAAYMATKAAGDVLVRALADEFGVRGIRINSIAPGPTEDSPMAAGVLSNESVRDRISRSTPLRRLGNTTDIAEAAVWLAGEACFVTGEVLQVNGGRAIPRLM